MEVWSQALKTSNNHCAVVVEQKEQQISNFLSQKEINQLGPPEDVRNKPEAKIADWEDSKLLVTGASSLATYSDKFRGRQTPINERYLRGFEQEFSENGELVAFVDEDISEEIGDTAVSNFAGITGNFVTDIRDPDEAWEVINEYREIYPGDWDKIEEDISSNRAVVPAIYSATENYQETGIGMRPLEGVQANDEFDINSLLEQEAEEVKPENLTDKRFEMWEAPENEEARYYIQFESMGEELEYDMRPGSITISSEGDTKVQTTPGASKVVDESSNNGLYFLKIG